MKRIIFLLIWVLLLFYGLTYSATTEKTKTKKTTTTKKTKTVVTKEKKTEEKKVEEKKPEKAVNFETYFKPGTMAVNLGIGFAFFWGGIDLYPGFEYCFYQFRINNLVPLDIGAAIRGVYYSWSSSYLGYNVGFVVLGAGVFGTIHFGFKWIKNVPEFLKKLDVYAGLGARFFYQSFTGEAAYLNSLGYNYGGLGISTLAGISYFITDNFAINLEGSYYGFGGGLIGILFKF